MARQVAQSEVASKREPSKEPGSAAEFGSGDRPSTAAFAVVGVGASAGGIDALGKFFDAMPADSGCAFVVVLHLDPRRESEMARVLTGHTAMPVAQIQDGMTIEPDRIYVIAPDTDIALAEGRLKVSKPSEPRGQRHPVDVLFASIASEQRERSIAVVLSGTGSNGTEGLKKIRAEGGMSLVQDPQTAQFDGMPRSAIAAGLADHVLAPGQMPEKLLSYIRHGYVAEPAAVEPAYAQGEATIEQILEAVQARNGQDFRSYKRKTLARRIHRRMGLRNIGTFAEYLRGLRENPQEADALAGDLMISVTGFFRDEEAWKALADLVIAPLMRERPSGGPFRVWVAGCATGEEAYSMAMLVTELAEAAAKRFDIKVFATDVQDGNLRKAREGIYPAAALAGFPPERTHRFFDKLDGSYQVSKALRDMVVFAAQNLLRDPPFSRLDIVSCRNFLIYLEPEAQQRVIAQFHFALRRDGFLFLGNAETIGRQDDLFDTVSKKWRIYRRIGQTRHDLIDYRPVRGPAGATAGMPLPAPPDAASEHVADIARRALLDRYAPASVLVDHKGRVVYFHGATRDYLEHPSGEPTRDILAMSRGELGLKLRGAMRDAAKGGKTVTAHGRIYRSGSPVDVAMTVMPLPDSPLGAKLTLVSFAPGVPAGEPDRPAAGEVIPETISGEAALQEELVSTRAELRNTIEHLETANEELKATNEESISMNEELQSANEELETSKEEMQSFNEELNTVNSQLQHKIGELERTTNDLNNLLAGSETATLFLDDKLAITWFAPATRELIDLQSTDIGRPIAHFARKFTDEMLLQDAETVLRKLAPIDAEVQSDAGRWFLRRMLPYRTRDHRIAGLVITFRDITERRAAAVAADDSRIYAQAIVETVRQPLLVLDTALRVQSANSAFFELFAVSAKETQGSLLFELGNRQWDIPALRLLLEEVLSKSHEVTGYVVEHDFRGIGWRRVLLNALKLVRGGGHDELILLAIHDDTDRQEREAALRASEKHLKDLIEALPGAVYTTDAEGLLTSFNPAAAELWGRSPELGKDRWCGAWRSYRPDGTPQAHNEGPMAIALREKRSLRAVELVAERPNGVRVPFLGYPTLLRDAAGNVTGAVSMLVDITERKRAEELADRFAAIVRSSDDAIMSKTTDGTITSWNIAAERLLGYQRDEIIGKSVMLLVPPERHGEEIDILARVRRGEHIQHYETLRHRKDGEDVWVSLTISPLSDSAGNVVGASTIARDMTERRRADEHRKILLAELNHRVKNTMAVFQSIASQTLSHAATLDEARHAISSRLINLAKAHDVLTRENWQSADLADIVSDTAKPLSGGDNRFHTEGPAIRLLPRAALAIAMALHELCTNAAKYGALSTENGRVEIKWRIEAGEAGPRMVLDWRESGGPPVAEPKRKGFGSRLIERALAAELGGEVRVVYAAAGLECTIVAPLPSGLEGERVDEETGRIAGSDP